MPYKLKVGEVQFKSAWTDHPPIIRSPEYSWTGKRLIVHVNESGRKANYIHELGHWLICSPTRRRMRDFGLGPGFQSKGSAPLIVSDSFAQREEVMVCTFEVAAFDAWGLDWQEPARVNSYEDWDRAKTWADYIKIDGLSETCVGQLNKRGLFKGIHPKDLPSLESLNTDRSEREVEEFLENERMLQSLG